MIYNPLTGRYEPEDHTNHHGGSPLDPWNSPSERDDPFAAWNNPVGGDRHGY